MKSIRIYKKKNQNIESPAVWSTPSTPLFINSALQQSQYFCSLSMTYTLQYLLSPAPKLSVSLPLLRTLAINIGGASMQSGRKESALSLRMLLTKLYALIAAQRNCYQMRYKCLSPHFAVAALDGGQRGSAWIAGQNLISLEESFPVL